MNQKKICSTIVIGIMLVSLVSMAVPVSAGYYRVSGYLYIDDEIASAGVEVTLSFDGDDLTDTTNENGHYQIDFTGHDGETGYFTVTYGADYVPTPDSVDIEQEDAYSIDLYIYTVNHPPYEPTLVAPSPSGTTGVDINADLSWTGGDPDGDAVTYDVSFGTTNPPPLTEEDHSSTTYDPGALGYETTYYWQIVAEDEHGASDTGAIWSFTTKSEDTGGNGGNGGNGGGGGGGGTPPIPPSTNQDPTADASASETVGFVNTPINFDGSRSSDPDGDTLTYAWDFDDGNTGSGETTTHTYTSTTGAYTVTLTVDDGNGGTDDDTIQVIISQPNLPPDQPDVSGPQTGSADTNYDYTAVTTDAENDTIQYIFDWDDGTNTTTDFVANGTSVTQTHNWSTWGVYTISVIAYDNQNAPSDTKDYVVLIDVIWVKNIGYLIDTDSDGITYDSFYSNGTGSTTDPQKLANGSYLINSDEDSGWDWIYDPDTDTLTEYSEGEEGEADNTIWYIAGFLVIIILLIISYMAMKKKEKKQEKPKKPKK